MHNDAELFLFVNTSPTCIGTYCIESLNNFTDLRYFFNKYKTRQVKDKQINAAYD